MQNPVNVGEEIDNNLRTLLEVTVPEPQGHVVWERTVAEAELRACRNFYREVPLTGCQQSALPTYRLPQAFGQIEVPDEHGLWDPSGRTSFPHTEPWIKDEKGEIFGFCLPDGSETSAEDVEQDARNWARVFGRDAWSCFAQNHDHDCTDTCVKYAASPPTSMCGASWSARTPRSWSAARPPTAMCAAMVSAHSALTRTPTVVTPLGPCRARTLGAPSRVPG